MKGFFRLSLILAVASTAQAKELTLDVAIQATLDKNPVVQNAKAEVERAAGRRLVLRAVGLPDGVVGIVGGDQGGHRAGQSSDQPFGFAYGALVQPIFDAQVPASYRRGDVELLIAEQQLNIAVEEQLHGARLAFYAALYNRSLATLRGEQRQRLKENATALKDRYNAGLADRGALASAEVQTRELDPRVGTAQRGYEGAVLKLAETIGDDLNANAPMPEPTGELTYAKVDADLSGETRRALEHRSDLKLARLLVKAANEDQRIIAAGYYPMLNATLGGEYIPVSGIRRQGEGSPRRTDDIISSELRIGATYTWRVIDNGKVYGAVKRQRQIREINELELRKLEADVPRSLARIRNDLDAIATKQKELLMATAAAEQNAIIVRQNLAGGITSPLEFRLIENSLLETKTALVTLAFQQKVALAEWDRATGRYLQFSEDSGQNVH
ncbi:MAG: outer membrane protein [Verrucomicrobiota bacterium]